MDPREAFKRDLEKGLEHEQIVLEHIQKKYPLARSIKGYLKDFDIWIPEIEGGIEVKSDEKSQTTGNIVIEIEFGGKPSALSTTKALYWVIWDGIEYSWLAVEDIRKCIKDQKLRIAKFTGRGDAKAKKAYLIRKKILWKYRTLVSKID